ncbi:putative secreted protein (Por secretion system target) [Flavobacterium araucananum]|uniref:Secretion protein n=1 Tax=Flavobacterium araucananum TaxID=946678 RepID=A0A227P3C4_9FLAO|nr:T9SS type A sorting domain-containing protein [Flavobacterium araucananum]OXG04411.1 secretion protein [Flavobacterium araucananum]PWK01188.1 putative secreted protein (Por secretion system target) [Flavobacterium araucananum]
MKKITFLILILATTKCISQIYFGPTANMYVQNEVLYVQQEVNMASTSNLYLRNNAQLVQGTTGVSSNTGAGILSLYQEGTSDNYDYNYWCSPVGNASATTGNENFGITMLSRPTSSIASVAPIILGSGSSNGTSVPFAIASDWIFKLINANNYSQWIFVGGATTLAPGEGFTMKGTSGTDTTDPEGTGITNNPGGAQRYDFRGKPNDGNITITLGNGNTTLTGNPYPSALHLNAFLLDGTNTATGGIAYFWEQDKTVDSHVLVNYRGGYGSYSPVSLGSNGVYVPATFNSYNADGSVNNTGSSSGLAIQRKYSPIGQGFVINATATGTAIFKNSHRAFYKEGSGFSQFEKHAPKEKNANKEATTEEVIEEVSHFKINAMINNQFTRQLALAFVPEATDGIDFGIDALDVNDALPNDVTFWLDDHNYVIQGINFDDTKKIPLAVKVATSTTFKFYIPEVVNFDTSQKIYLYDALDSSYHDIKTGTYEVTVAPGIYADRFKITFKNETTLGIGDQSSKHFFIAQDNVNSHLKVSNPNNYALKSFKLYDMLGKVVLAKKDLGSDQNYIFSTSGLSNGVYITEFLTTDNERFTEKIIISNSGK